MSQARRKVVLVAWDCADWNIIQPMLDRGEMPALAGLMESGASGKLATVHPTLSPIVWNSLGTGKTADRHGVLSAKGESGPQSRRARMLWDILSAQGDVRTHVVGWPFAGAAEALNGVYVSQRFATEGWPTAEGWPAPKGSVTPVELLEALSELRVHPTDLGAAALLPLVPRAQEIDQTRDDSLARIALSLSVTCSLHNAATWILEQKSWDFLAVGVPGIGDISRLFMQYHAPRMPEVDARRFELFQGVVTGVYRFHDMLLERIRQLAGPDATVMLVSSHGFESGARRRPRRKILDDPAAAHRTFGILAIGGPGVLRDELLHWTSILDIAPTVLALFGLPAGKDMAGRALTEAWEDLAVPQRVASWEAVPSEPSKDVEWKFREGLAHQFEGFQDAAVGVVRDAALAEQEEFRLASVYMTTGRPRAALPLLRALTDAAPEELDYQRALLQCYLALDMSGHAKQLLDGLFAGPERHAFMSYFQGVIRLAERDRTGALQAFQEAEAMDPKSDFLRVLIGHCYSGNRMWGEADAAYRAALERDGDNAEAHSGMARIALHRKQNAEAAQHALAALGARYEMPAAHLQLGTAMARMCRYDEAELSLRLALRMSPRQKSAQRLLGVVLARKTMEAKV